MRRFRAVFRISMRQYLQYRAAALAGVVTQGIFALIYSMVYVAYYESQPDAQTGMTLAQAVNYAWITEACLPMMTLSGLADVQEMMRDGRIAFELTRPAQLSSLWFARSLARRLTPFLLNTPFLLLIASLMPGKIRFTLEVSALPLGLVSMTLAVLVCAAITVLMTASCFYTVAGDGVNRLIPMIATFCSGALLPLEFFPTHLRNILRALPFAAVTDAPLRILVGAAGTREALYAVALQVVWLAILLAVGSVLTQRGIRKHMVQGG